MTYRSVLEQRPKGPAMDLTFGDAEVLNELAAANSAQLDALPFGVVGMSNDGIVISYNAFESRHAGLAPARVIGRHFFTQVAPCTNNHLIAGRFETECTLDHTMNYMLTLRMQLTKVRLRLLKASDGPTMFLLIDRR